MPKFFTRWNLPPKELRGDCDNFDETLTQQHFKDECDINNIIARYQVTGLLTDPSVTNVNRTPLFGDFSELPHDYQSAQTFIMEAQEQFASMPSTIRAHFHDDPGDLLAAFDNPARHAELVELGIIADGPAAREVKTNIPLPVDDVPPVVDTPLQTSSKNETMKTS